MSDFEEEWIDRDMDFRDEVGAYNRAGGGNILMGKDRILQDPYEKFATYVDAICRSINSKDVVNISEASIQVMVEKARGLNNIEYKNPGAYILGFLGSQGGKRIDEKTVKNVIKNVLPTLGTDTILPPDVVRYSKLWLSL